MQFAEQIAKKCPESVARNSQKSSSASSGNAVIEAHFTTEAFLKELKNTREVMRQEIATSRFFPPNSAVYDALLGFEKAYGINAQSTSDQIMRAMKKLHEVRPEICKESSAKTLLKMMDPPSSGCVLQ